MADKSNWQERMSRGCQLTAILLIMQLLFKNQIFRTGWRQSCLLLRDCELTIVPLLMQLLSKHQTFLDRSALILKTSQMVRMESNVDEQHAALGAAGLRQ